MTIIGNLDQIYFRQSRINEHKTAHDNDRLIMHDNSRAINKVSISPRRNKRCQTCFDNKVGPTLIPKSAIPNILVFMPEPLNGVNHAVENKFA